MSIPFRGIELEDYAIGSGSSCNAEGCFFGLDDDTNYTNERELLVPIGPYKLCPTHVAQLQDEQPAARAYHIDKPFAYHKPSTEGLDKINRLREHFSEGERLIRELTPSSRHQSVALTENETTAMWAIKAVVFNDPDSEVA